MRLRPGLLSPAAALRARVAGSRAGTAVVPVACRIAADPLEVFMGVISILSATAYLLGAPTPGSVDQSLPFWFIRVWGIFLLVGGAAIVGGIVTGHYPVFIAGLRWLAGGIAVYVVAILAATHLHGAQLQAAVDVALAVALIIRAGRKGASWATTQR